MTAVATTTAELIFKGTKWWTENRAEYGQLPILTKKQHDTVIAALSAASVSAWQDISTAPKDGTEIDLWCISLADGAGSRFAEMFFNDGNWEDWKSYRLEPKWKPTHWMPVPAGPITPPSQDAAREAMTTDMLDWANRDLEGYMAHANAMLDRAGVPDYFRRIDKTKRALATQARVLSAAPVSAPPRLNVGPNFRVVPLRVLREALTAVEQFTEEGPPFALTAALRSIRIELGHLTAQPPEAK